MSDSKEVATKSSTDVAVSAQFEEYSSAGFSEVTA